MKPKGDEQYIVFKTETCNRCPIAVAAIKRHTGSDAHQFYLDAQTPEADETIGLLKENLGTAFLELPIVMAPDGRLIRNLAELATEFRK